MNFTEKARQKLTSLTLNSDARQAQSVVAVCILGFLILSFMSAPSLSIGLKSNFLPIHTILEFIATLVSFGIFTVGWATFRNVRTSQILILCIASYAVGWLDLGHTLSFTGMPAFITDEDPNKSIYFWLFGRLIGSAALFAVAILPSVKIQKPVLFRHLLGAVSFLVVGIFFVVLFEYEHLPILLVPGVKFTAFKIMLESICIALSLSAGILFFRPIGRERFISYNWLGSACLVFAISGLFFLEYTAVDGLFMFAGHIYKVIAYALVYRAVFVECVGRPFDEMKDLARKASDANRSKTRFLANVSHEFRTPLGIISGFSDLILESNELSPQTREWTELIARNSKQLRSMIDDLLDLSKAESDKISVNYENFNPIEVMQNVVAEFQQIAERKKIRIIFKACSHPISQILSDQLRFRQILVNVIGNAVKFTDHGQITVSCFCDGTDLLKVSVQDTGIGIDVANIDQLFKPFSQVDDSFDRRFAGTGLGLALSRRLARLLGGNLILESSSSEIGSVFSFTIANQLDKRDLTTTGPFKAADPALLPQVYLFKGKSILIAEDIEDNRKLLERYFAPTTASITFAKNGREALEQIKTVQFDLVLMDIQMPEMDGFTATEEIRKLNRLLPIIALSAHAHPTEKERALRMGFNDYLVKPVSRAELMARISSYL